MKKLLTLLLFASPLLAQAPPSTFLDPSRFIDWRANPSVQFTIPSGTWTQCTNTNCNTVTSAGTGATVTQINSAIQGAPVNTYVLLAAGTYSLNGCINWAGHDFVVLRGAGPTRTILKFSGGSCGGGLSGGAQIMMAAAVNTFDQNGNNLPGGSNSLNITGTVEGGVGVYPQGATHLTVSSVGSDVPQVGTLLMVDQADDTVVAAGWLQCASNSSTNPGVISGCSENGNNNGRKISGVNYEQVQVVRITNIAGSTYTITPGLYANNIRSSQTPGAWWNPSSSLCIQCGIENLTIDTQTNGPNIVSAINVYDCYQCWITNARVFYGGARNTFYVAQSSTFIAKNNYFAFSTGSSSGGGYVFDVVEASDVLVENNIFDQVDNPFIFENGSGWIAGYNFSRQNIFVGPQQVIDVLPSHDSGSMMDLYEGNIFTQVSQDTQHGPSPVITYFRNRIEGNQPVPFSKTNFTTPIELQAFEHGENFIGNVLGIAKCSGGTFNGLPADMNSQCTGGTLTGGSYQSNYQASPGTTTTGCPNVIWMIGWPTGACSSSSTGLGAPFLSDTGVENELMRWANFDTVNGVVRFNSTEASPTATPFLPANFTPTYFNGLAHTLPISFYYNNIPSWWHGVGFTTPPFPPIGPDVTGGDMGGVGGFANRNLARLCYDNTPQDATNYPGTTIIAFDANNCYSSSSPSPAPAPAPAIFAFARKKD